MFKSISFSRLLNPEFYSFLERLLAIFSAFDLVTLQLESFVQKVQTAFNHLDAAMIQNKGSIYTGMMSDADELRDDAFLALRNLVVAYTYYPDETLKSHAERLEQAIRTHGWTIQRLGLTQQTAVLSNLIGDLENNADLAAAITALNATPFLNVLKEKNALFTGYQSQRLDEKSEKPEISTTDARREAREAVENLFNVTEALYLMNQDETYQQIANQVNPLVDEFNSLIKSREAR